MNPLKINQNFKSIIPPLSDDELRGLEESVLSYGRPREDIKVWKDTIIDGHNRYAICQKHNLPYSTKELRFRSKKDAELWIVHNQLGRRNLDNATRIRLALRKEDLLRERAKQNRSGSNGTTVHVRRTIAKDAGVGEGTVYKYMQIRALGTPELLRRVDTGATKITAAYQELQGLEQAVEVTTRTVEPLASTRGPANLNNPSCRMAVADDISIVANLYEFLSDNSLILCGGDIMPRVREEVRSHVEVVGGL